MLKKQEHESFYFLFENKEGRETTFPQENECESEGGRKKERKRKEPQTQKRRRRRRR